MNDTTKKGLGVLSSRVAKIGLLLAVVAVVAFILLARGRIATRHGDIASFEAERGEFVIAVTESGELEAKNAINVSAPSVRTSSRRLQIVELVPEGTEVKEGDFLIQFDTQEVQKQINDEEAELEISHADLEKERASQASLMAQLESNLQDAQASYELAQLRLEQVKYEADVEVEKARLELQRAEIALKQAGSKLEAQKVINRAELQKLSLRIRQAEEELAKAERGLEDLTVKAPKPGLVVHSKIWKGGDEQEKIKVGDQTWPGQKLIEIPDLSVMLLKTHVNEVDISKVVKGQEVEIRLDAFDEPTFHGIVTEIASLARKKEQESDVKVFDVTVGIDHSDPKLKPGMTARAEIVVEKIPDVVYVPIEAVFEKEDTTVVYTISSLPRPTKVKTGKRNDNYVVL
ncbi:hypothetical protein AMJ82_11600, partial [candidate division TA06 bacterium SM23_40]